MDAFLTLAAQAIIAGVSAGMFFVFVSLFYGRR